MAVQAGRPILTLSWRPHEGTRGARGPREVTATGQAGRAERPPGKASAFSVSTAVGGLCVYVMEDPQVARGEMVTELYAQRAQEAWKLRSGPGRLGRQVGL